MTNNAMTVKLWSEITEIQAETLNGGSGAGKFNFYGPVGPVQINEGDGVQINPGTINQSVNNYNRGRRRYH